MDDGESSLGDYWADGLGGAAAEPPAATASPAAAGAAGAGAPGATAAAAELAEVPLAPPAGGAAAEAAGQSEADAGAAGAGRAELERQLGACLTMLDVLGEVPSHERARLEQTLDGLRRELRVRARGP